jgi:hypothetical protein
MSQRYTLCNRVRLISLPVNARVRPPEDSCDDLAPQGSATGGELLLMREDFQLRLANNLGRRSESKALIDRMYGWRGYRRPGHDNLAQIANQATLQTCTGSNVFGTLTVRYDSVAGLAADALYRTEIDAYRTRGRVAELTRLAVDPTLGSKQVLGALFHAAYVFCGPLAGVTDVFIEVNPRHVAFYQRMLHFGQAGEPKICPRVEAPAVLLHVNVAHVGEQAALYGGNPEQGQRSLFPYFCSGQEGQQLTDRARRIFGK